MVRVVADILVRTVVTGALAWLAGWLMVLAAGDDSGGANIGAGLAAFAVVALVALVWTFVDVRRDGRWVRTVLVWVAVGVLLALLSAMNAQGWTVRPDVEVLLQDIWGFLGFLSCLAAVPAGLGASAGYAVHENRARST